MKHGSLSTRREWVEILLGGGSKTIVLSLSPHGESGLKYPVRDILDSLEWSLSVWREWVEIFAAHCNIRHPVVSLCMKRVRNQKIKP